MRYVKHFKQSEWDRFDWDKQEILCTRYKIILDDWTPKWNRRYTTLKKYVNQKNFDKGIKEFNNIITTITTSLDALGKEMDSDWKPNKKSNKKKIQLWNNSEWDFILGKKK